MLENKRILIAGAGGLLGSVLTKHLLEQGASVLASDINLDAMRSRLEGQDIDLNSDRLSFATLDVNDEPAVTDFFANTTDIDGAVNCSYPRNKNYGRHFFDVKLADFNDNVSLQLGATFLFSQQCAAYFMAHKKPFSLVNISSIYGVVAPRFEVYEGTPMTTPVEYAAVKSALLHLNSYIANYIGNSDFRVNSVSPGGILDNQPEKFLAAYRRNTHGHGMIDSQNVVGAISYLLSDSARFVTAQNIVVDDGFSL